MMWVLFALLSAFFAAVTSILAKIGIEGINSISISYCHPDGRRADYGVGDCVCNRYPGQISDISRKKLDFSHSIRFGNQAFWLFFYKALQMGEASKVVPIDKFSVVISMVLAFLILGKITPQTVIGGIFDNGGHFCDDPGVR